jgi:hypothetical protein
MSLMERTFVGADSQLSPGSVASLGLAVAAQLEGRFPLQTQKCVAQALSCTPKAAENLLRGHLSTRTATMIIEVFGPGFMADAVMAAAGTTLANFIRRQAAEANASAHHHQEKARELAQLETELRASRRPQPAGRMGRAP